MSKALYLEGCFYGHYKTLVLKVFRLRASIAHFQGRMANENAVGLVSRVTPVRTLCTDLFEGGLLMIIQ